RSSGQAALPVFATVPVVTTTSRTGPLISAPPAAAVSSFAIIAAPASGTSTLSLHDALPISPCRGGHAGLGRRHRGGAGYAGNRLDRKSTRLNSSHVSISYAVFCLKKKKKITWRETRANAITTSHASRAV